MAITVSLRRPALAMPVGAAAGQYFQHGRVADLGAYGVLEGGVDAGEQAADPVADPGSFAGQVVVEPDQHLQLGQGLVADIDRAQGVGQRAGGVGDDDRIPGIGLRAAGVIGGAAHGQARQVGDLVTGRASDRDGQRPDRGRLVDHDQQRSVPGEFVEQGSQFGFGVGGSSVADSSSQQNCQVSAFSLR